MSTTHTPGPWFVADHDDFVVAAGDGFSICDCVPGNPIDVTDAQGVANARLIAAAPELLAALHGFEREISSRFGRDDDMSPALRVVVDAARHAVAKAEGRS